MGTLTAQSERLPGYCEHKLPTSCRLTSISNCCACADNRAHSATYSTYVDGIGLVPRGTRWQRYCWFCKEFWSNRVAATDLQPSQTRIPEVPDQTEFLKRWYEFHRGYRIVRREDGTEERMAVLGEPFADVAPGQLPRTLEELRAGLNRSAADERQHIRVITARQPDGGPSLEDTLDSMIDAAAAEEPVRAIQRSSQRQDGIPTQVAGNVMTPRPSRNREDQTRRIALLRRELNRMRTGVERVIDGLRDLGEDVPASVEATRRLAELDRSLEGISRQRPEATTTSRRTGRGHREIQTTASADGSLPERITQASEELERATAMREEANRRLAEIHQHLALAQATHEEAQLEAQLADADARSQRQELEALQRRRREMDNFRRVFGTREEMERDDYVSPIGGLFSRMDARYEDAERTRREQDHLRQVLESERTAVSDPSENRPPMFDFPRSMIPRRTAIHSQGAHDQIDRFRNAASQSLLEQRWGMDFPLDPQNHAFMREVPSSRPHAHAHPSGLESPSNRSHTVFVNTTIRDMQSRNPPLARESRSAYLTDLFRSGPAADSTPPAPTTDTPRTPFPADWPRNMGLLSHSPRPVGLDIDAERPAQRTDEEMNVNLECKICYSQLADTACLPCGHLVMCRWCSEQHGPTHRHDKTRPAALEFCPLCRKKLKQKVRVRLG